MSYYTKVILVLRYADTLLKPVEGYFENLDCRGQFKECEMDTYTASMNHLNVEKFRTHIENVCKGKVDASCVQLLIMDEDDDRYKEIPLRLDVYPDLGIRALQRADKICAHCNPEKYTST